MFFSVIIPTFNRLSFLKNALASVLAQEFKDFEVLIVDDGSTDKTKEWVFKQKDTRIRYFFSDKNRGVSISRNIGIKKANGSYICFLDSDDIWFPEKLALQEKYFRKKTHYFVCHTDETWKKNGTHLNQKKIHQKKEGFFFKDSVQRCLVSPSTVAINKAVFTKYGLFDESLPVCEDYDLWLRLNMFLPFGFINKKLVIKRGGHEGQLSKSFPFMDLYRVRSMVKILKDGYGENWHHEVLRKEIFRKLTILKNGALKHKNNTLLSICSLIEYQL